MEWDFATFLVAVLLAWVQIQNMLIRREEVKLRLFEERIAIYRAVLSYVEDLSYLYDMQDFEDLEFRVGLGEKRNSYFKARSEAPFLFPDGNLCRFINQLFDIEIRTEDARIVKGTDSPDFLELRKWWVELVDELPNKFAKHMRITLPGPHS